MFKKAVLSRMMVWILAFAGVAGLGSAGPALAQGQFGKPFHAVNELGLIVADSAQGARVEQVTPDSLAAALGLQANDLITAVNDQPVDAEHSLEARLSASGLLSGLKLRVERDGQVVSLELTQAEIDAAPSGEATLVDHLRALIGPQLAGVVTTRTTPPDQPTIAQSLSGRLEATHGWMIDMLRSLRDLFATFQPNAKIDTAAAAN